MVACGSRVGLRRYCTLLGEAGVTLTEDDYRYPSMQRA
jgi:hypothetical protein